MIKKSWLTNEIFLACIFFILATAAINYEMLLDNHLPYYGGMDVSIYLLPPLRNIFVHNQSSPGWYPYILCGVPSTNLLIGNFYNPIQLLSPFFPFFTAHSVLVFIYMALGGLNAFIFLNRGLRFKFWSAIFGGCIYYCLPSTLCFHTANSGINMNLGIVMFPLLVYILLESWDRNSTGLAIVFSAAVSTVSILSYPIIIAIYFLLFTFLLASHLLAGVFIKKINYKNLLLQLLIIAGAILLFLGPYYWYLSAEASDSPRIYKGAKLVISSLKGEIKAIFSFIAPVVPNFHAPSLLPLLAGLSLLFALSQIIKRKNIRQSFPNDLKSGTMLLFSGLTLISIFTFTGDNPVFKSELFSVLGWSYYYFSPISISIALSFLCAVGMESILSGDLSKGARSVIKYSFLLTGFVYSFFFLILGIKLARLDSLYRLLSSLIPHKLSLILEKQYLQFCSGTYGYLLLICWAAVILLLFYNLYSLLPAVKLQFSAVFPVTLLAPSLIMQGWWIVKPTFSIEDFYNGFNDELEMKVLGNLTKYDRIFVDQNSENAHQKELQVPYSRNYLTSSVPSYYGASVADGELYIYSQRTNDFLNVTEKGLEYIIQPVQNRYLFRMEKAYYSNKRKMLDMLGISYFFSSQPLDSVDSLIFLGKGKIYYIYKNLKVLPKLALYENAVYCDTPLRIFSKILENDFDPADQCVIEKPGIIDNQPGESKSDLLSSVYEKDYISCRVKAEKSCILKVADSFHRFWRAYIDGREVPVLHVDYMFRGVWVPEGEHEIEMKFIVPFWLSMTLKATLTISIMIILSWGIFALNRMKIGRD